MEADCTADSTTGMQENLLFPAFSILLRDASCFYYICGDFPLFIQVSIGRPVGIFRSAINDLSSEIIGRLHSL